MNLGRLVHLFVVGTSNPESFALVHEVVWQGLMGVAVSGSWMVWTLWAERRWTAPSGDATRRRVRFGRLSVCSTSGDQR